MPDKIQKRPNESIKRKKKTVIENIYKLGKFPGIDVAFTIRQMDSILLINPPTEQIFHYVFRAILQFNLGTALGKEEEI
jgi:hypothetical protein